MLIIIFYVVIVLLYSIGGGATYKAIKTYHKDACESKFFGSVFWPIAVAGWAGIWLTSTIGSPAQRVETRRDKEIAEAEHRLELARIQARESAELDRMLK